MTKKSELPLPPSVGEKKKKKAESKYDSVVLRRLIKEGKNASEVMQEMGIAHKQILKHHVLKLCTSDKTFYEVPGLYERNNRKVFVNSRGEIHFKMNNIDFGDIILTPDTEFDIKIEDNRIILTNLSMTMEKPLEDHKKTIDGAMESQYPPI